jgi:hypothetical protein
MWTIESGTLFIREEPLAEGNKCWEDALLAILPAHDKTTDAVNSRKQASSGADECNRDFAPIVALHYSGMVVLLGNVNRIVIADTRDTNAAAVLRYCMLAATCRDMKRSIVLKTNPVANDANRNRSYFPRL